MKIINKIKNLFKNKLANVDYKIESGKLIAVETYSDGSKRKVQIKKGIVDYILEGENSGEEMSKKNELTKKEVEEFNKECEEGFREEEGIPPEELSHEEIKELNEEEDKKNELG
jgi:hypothetical protein